MVEHWWPIKEIDTLPPRADQRVEQALEAFSQKQRFAANIPTGQNLFIGGKLKKSLLAANAATCVRGKPWWYFRKYCILPPMVQLGKSFLLAAD
ncbi:MAG: hypothetical protein SPK23_06190 [Eubacteriales bacterium]|nr:hypothetical protein [Clostridiales bacterium]MDY5836691.1 hypothetical protein [Eubacteriales bacterium]